MEIVPIQYSCLYAVQYDGETYDEYNRIFEEYADLETVHTFFEENKWKIGQYYIKELGWPATETEAYTNHVIQEVEELEDYFEDLIDNTTSGLSPSLSSHFMTLEGFEKEQTPAMKSYGLARPSLIRIYAVEVEHNCLIIFYSGIKINHSLSECPILKDNVLSKARNLISFLKENGIYSAKELNQFISNGK